MNGEDIIRMAREAGFTIGPVTREIYSAPGGFYAELERFFQAAYAAGAAAEREKVRSSMKRAFRRMAGLIRADEREACAKVADDHERQRCKAWAKVLTTGGEVPSASLSAVAAAIRARGQA